MEPWIMEWVRVTRYWQDLLGQILAGNSPRNVSAQVKVSWMDSLRWRSSWVGPGTPAKTALITCGSLHLTLPRCQASFLGDVLRNQLSVKEHCFWNPPPLIYVYIPCLSRMWLEELEERQTDRYFQVDRQVVFLPKKSFVCPANPLLLSSF